ncbi:hypothetical protein HID58_045885, partial [Brassica napus]
PPPDYESKMSSSPFVKSYLFAYNFLQASSWTISLLSIVSSVLSNKTIIGGAYSAAGYLISVMQTVAVLEVLHGAIGIVPSGFLSPLMQWSGRTHFILAIVGQINEVQDSPWLAITLVGWCIGEMIRYPHYALTCLGRCPYWLTYLRYTGFIIIYPTGLVGELLIMYKALPHVKERNLYANFFSVFPFSYYQFLWAVLLVYPFLWLKLYLQLFKQRKSKLGKAEKHHGKRKRMTFPRASVISDSDYFMKVVRNKYRSRRLQKLFGISDDVDAFFYAAILRRFFHIITDNYASYGTLLSNTCLNCMTCVAGLTLLLLRGHCVDLSFKKYGSYIVEKLLEAEESMAVVVLEFLECGGDGLMRLARNEFGNFVVFKAMRVTQEMSRVDLFWGLVHKLMPFLDLLRRSHGSNIANILESTI